jgi:crotonobetainyl-CoA:carnitine CoA-transferase CaiB-like acyl-CoA transferase
MSAPLSGLRVLDLSNVLAGPFCAYQLALQGAEVIKVEAPGSGDLARQLGHDPALSRQGMGASFLAQNAGKRSITLNLKSAAGKAVFHRLLETADVLVENFRPGVMERLGLGHETLRAAHPRLIYCAISGFGQTGPMSGAPAYDQIVQGLSGVMSITGGADTAPLRVGYPACDTIGGITAAFAISSALVRLARTGEGAFIDVSMLDATLTTMGWVVSNYLLCGQAPVPMGNDNFTAAPSGAFRTGEGLLNIAANKQEQYLALVELIGRPDLAADSRFAEREARKRNRAALTIEVEAGLASRSAAEWEALFNKAGIPSGRVLSVPEALALPQIQARGLVRNLGRLDGIAPEIAVTGAGFIVDGGDGGEPLAAPPRLGEDTDTILAELGYAESDIAAFREQGVL